MQEQSPLDYNPNRKRKFTNTASPTFSYIVLALASGLTFRYLEWPFSWLLVFVSSGVLTAYLIRRLLLGKINWYRSIGSIIFLVVLLAYLYQGASFPDLPYPELAPRLFISAFLLTLFSYGIKRLIRRR